MTKAPQSIPGVILDSFAAVFGDRIRALTRETASADIDGWDSIANVNLLLEIEDRAKIRFRPSEVLNLRNVGELVDLVSRKMQPR